MVQLSTLHIWINSHIFQNIIIFMKQCCILSTRSKIFKLKFVFSHTSWNILTRWQFHKIILIVHKTINYRYDHKCFMFCLHRNNCIYTVCMKLVHNVSNYIIDHSNAFLSSSIRYTWLEFRRDEMFYPENDFQVDLENFEFNLKFHAERIQDKCRIWCYDYNFYRIPWPIVIIQDNQNAS